MQLGNRIFPYPVLNNAKELSEFTEKSTFELKITLDKDNQIIKTRDNVVLKDVYFSLCDDSLMKLYQEGKMTCYLIVESSSSIYRHRFILKDVPQTYEIPIGCLKDDVYLSAYCIANCDIEDYTSNSFEEDYKEYTFDIKQYDILAADDGFKFTMDRNLSEDNKVSSIFVIVKDESSSKSISYDMRQDKIYIYLPSEQHDKYNNLKRYSDYNDIFFSMIAIPVLTACFSELKNMKITDSVDFSEFVERYRWFKSVMNSYQKEKGKELNADDFETLQSLELAQLVFNYASIKGISKFSDLVINYSVGGNEDE